MEAGLMKQRPPMGKINYDDLVPYEGERLISASIFSSEEIYRQELEGIFDRTWVFVGHESELPNQNDFVLRYIGEDPVIVTHDLDGGFSVLLNSCSHRGPGVCRAEAGNAAIFRCPYHGWTYENTGELVGVMGERVVYGDRLDKSKLGLKRARVGNYHGLLFATWNEDAPSLEDHLGPFRYYLDLLFGLPDNGMEVIGPPQRWIIPCNWKFGADNSSGDNYHVGVAHESLAAAAPGLQLDPASTASRVFNITDDEHGHSVTGFIQPDASMPPEAWLDIASRIGGIPPSIVPELRAKLNDHQIETFLRTSAGVGNIFPNLGWIRTGSITAEGVPPQAAVSLRLWHPRGPDKTEVYAWTLVPRDAPEEVKLAAGEQMVRTFGISGNFEQDDADIWVGIQQATRGVQGGRRKLNYSVDDTPDETWGGPGTAYRNSIIDTNQWNFYARWRDQLASQHNK